MIILNANKSQQVFRGTSRSHQNNIRTITHEKA